MILRVYHLFTHHPDALRLYLSKRGLLSCATPKDCNVHVLRDRTVSGALGASQHVILFLVVSSGKTSHDIDQNQFLVPQGSERPYHGAMVSLRWLSVDQGKNDDDDDEDTRPFVATLGLQLVFKRSLCTCYQEIDMV
jgi:hypothetical protein